MVIFAKIQKAIASFISQSFQGEPIGICTGFDNLTFNYMDALMNLEPLFLEICNAKKNFDDDRKDLIWKYYFPCYDINERYHFA